MQDSVQENILKLMKGYQLIELNNLPESFLEFLKEKRINHEIFLHQIPRYIRIRHGKNLNVEEIAKDLKINVNQIVRIDEEFFALQPEIKINNCSLYEDGTMFGMDIGSAMPCICLNVKDGHNLMELCSAPGNKSMYIADHFNVKIVAVEVSENRANIMKNLINKYRFANKISIVVADGVKYVHEDEKGTPMFFDRVLVDAECTHEGSLKHIMKFNKHKIKNKKDIKLSKQQENQFETNNVNPYTSKILNTNEWSEEDFRERFLDETKMMNLKILQKGLLANGFNHLKVDGILVYSTCSYDQNQNELIIEEFLNKNENARLLNASEFITKPISYESGSLKGTLRFNPKTSLCGGMFVSVITKF